MKKSFWPYFWVILSGVAINVISEVFIKDFEMQKALVLKLQIILRYVIVVAILLYIGLLIGDVVVKFFDTKK